MTEPAPASVPDQGLFARAIGVIFSPGATFAGVVARPRPAGILLLTSLVVALAAGLPQFTEHGRQTVLDMQVRSIERFTGQPVNPDMYEQMRSRTQYAGYTTLASTLIVAPVFALFFAAIFWFAFNAILGGTALFKQVLAIVTHAGVIGALAAVVSAPITYLQDSPSMAGPFNLGALVPMLEPDSFLASLLGFISVFVIWQIIVTAIGLGVLYRRKTRNIAIGLMSAYLLLAAVITTGLSALTGR